MASNKKLTYENIKNAKGVIDRFIQNKQTFTLHETKYSKKLVYYPTLNKLPKVEDKAEMKKVPKITILFNAEGKQDIVLLGLINKVRNDASKFKGDINKDNINFFSLVDRPRYGTLVQKIDLKAAYWTCALQKMVIQQSTDQYLKEKTEGENTKYIKHSRLKALGSLATIKKISNYENGQIVQFDNESDYEIVVQPTRELYMEVCRGVDQIMRKAALIPGVFYYYWDCIFCHKEAQKPVFEYIKDIGYNCSMDTTRIEYVTVGENGYIVSTSDKKVYMVRKEDYHLLKNTERYEHINWESDIIHKQ